MATAQDDAALSRAAPLTREHLGHAQPAVTTVSARQNRRRIDLIPEPEWTDPPKARIGEAAGGGGAPPAAARIGGLADAVAICRTATAGRGLRDVRVTSDVKHRVA